MPPVTAPPASLSLVQPIPAGGVTEQCSEHGCWPTVYVIGAQKSATTSLFTAFADHHEICGRHNAKDISTAAKEAHFFDDPMDNQFDGTSLRSAKDLHKYLGGYPKGDCKGSYMDATPAYLRDLKVPARMQEVMPESVIKHHVRIVAILREPVSRDLSYYNMFKYMWVQQGKPKHKVEDMGEIADLALCKKTHGFPSYAESIGCQMELWNDCMECKHDCSAEDNIKAHKKCAYKNSDITKKYSRVTDGMYYAQLEKFETVFPRKHMMVVSFDGLIDHQAKYMQAIGKFMGVPNPHKVTKLPEDNDSDFSGKVHKPACSTAGNLHDVFRWWNEKLDTKMKRDKEEGKAPEDEPHFVPFSSPKCGELEDGE